MWLSLSDVVEKLAVPGLSVELLGALLVRCPSFLPQAEQLDSRGWVVPSTVVDALLAGDESVRLAGVSGCRAVSFGTLAELLEADEANLRRSKHWRSKATKVPSVGLRVPFKHVKQLLEGVCDA